MSLAMAARPLRILLALGLLVLTVLVLLALLAVESHKAEAAPGDKLYWSDPVAGKIQRADLDGSNIEDVLTGLASPRDLEVDQAAGKLYWISDAGIRRANFDGSGAENVAPGTSATRFALDPVRARVYWTEFTANRVRRADYDGTNVEDVVTPVGVFGPLGIAIDATNSFLYWSDAVVVTRSDLDGNGAVTTGVPMLFGIASVALDPSLSLVWTEYAQRSGVLPCGAELIGGPGGIITPADLPSDLVVGAGAIYWAENAQVCPIGPPRGEPRIRKWSGGSTVDLVTGLSSTGGVAIVNFPPPPVGGVSLDTGLRPLALEAAQPSSAPWAVVAVGIAGAAGLVAAAGAAWYARRRR